MATRKQWTAAKSRKVKADLRAADKKIAQAIRSLQALQRAVRNAVNDLPPGGGGDITNRPPT